MIARRYLAIVSCKGCIGSRVHIDTHLNVPVALIRVTLRMVQTLMDAVFVLLELMFAQNTTNPAITDAAVADMPVKNWPTKASEVQYICQSASSSRDGRKLRWWKEGIEGFARPQA